MIAQLARAGDARRPRRRARPEARAAATAADAAAAGDVVVVTVPLKAVPGRPGRAARRQDRARHEQLLLGARRPHRRARRRRRHRSPGCCRSTCPTSKVAKAFNHIGAADITTDGTPAGTPDRRALATASDHPDAAAFVTALYDQFGFDTVNIGPLSESWRVERDRPAYVVRQNPDELEGTSRSATRLPQDIARFEKGRMLRHPPLLVVCTISIRSLGYQTCRTSTGVGECPVWRVGQPANSSRSG